MNEQAIVERLQRLEEKVEPIAESAAAISELREQLAPRVNEAVQALIIELVDVEEDFQVEDLVFFTKNMLRNVKNLTYALDQLKNIIDFVRAVEPLLKTTVPQIISFFDELEQKGVLKLFTEVPAKIDFRESKDIGLFDMIKGMNDPQIKAGLGVVFELTRGLSVLNTAGAASAKEGNPAG